MGKDRNPIIIYIGQREVRFLREYKHRWGRRTTVHYESVACETGFINGTLNAACPFLSAIVKAYREKTFCKSFGKKVPVYLIIPFHNGLIRRFKMPWIKKKDRDSAIRYYIRQEIPILTEDFALDYKVDEDESKDYLEIQLCAVRNDVIKGYAECLSQAGYDIRGGEYLLLALGDFIASQNIEEEGELRNRNEKSICIFTLGENRVQYIIFEGGFPQVVRESDLNEIEAAKYHLYMMLKDNESPLQAVFTDDSPQTRMLANQLIDQGLVKENRVLGYSVNKGEGVYNDKSDISHISLDQLVLQKALKRTKDKRSFNLCKTLLRPIKVRLLLNLVGTSLISLFLLGGGLGYPLWQDYHQIQEDIKLLQEEIKLIHNDPDQMTWEVWQQEHKASCDNLQSIQGAIHYLDQEMVVTKLNYKQGTLFLWLECQQNTSITSLIGNLMAEGWKEPTLLDYQYVKNRISCCLSVQR